MTAPTVDDIAQLCFELACDEVREILGGSNHICMDDMTACEMVALLAVLRPAWERRRAAQRQPGAGSGIGAVEKASTALVSNPLPDGWVLYFLEKDGNGVEDRIMASRFVDGVDEVIQCEGVAAAVLLLIRPPTGLRAPSVHPLGRGCSAVGKLPRAQARSCVG